MNRIKEKYIFTFILHVDVGDVTVLCLTSLYLLNDVRCLTLLPILSAEWCKMSKASVSVD